ncbi:cobalamin B12-binding domain-containing protein [Balneolaceae bacterium ANBcel3]|nr:cobalamin B12-binding domain-containing protein [Balneolaceae bacterium ANBcel3]
MESKTTETSQNPVIDSEVLFTYLIQGKRKEASEFIQECVQKGYPILHIYEEIIKPALYHVGEYWENNFITVAEEHTATSIVEFLMNGLFEQIISKERVQKKIILACTEKETHRVGLKMVADIFEMKGWDTYFPGATIPVGDLIKYIEQVRPNILALSTSVYFHLPSLEKMLKNIKKAFPDLPVIVGGQAFRHGGKEVLQSFDNTFYIADLKSLMTFIDFFESEHIE